MKTFAIAVLGTVLLGIGASACAEAPLGAEVALQAKYRELRPQWPGNAIGAPLTLSSSESSDRVAGEVHAELGYPFAQVATALTSASRVCELLFLHLNVRSCRASTNAEGDTLSMSFGPKRADALGPVYSVAYKMRIEADTAAYLRVSLSAADGPLSTSDYHITFEAAPVGSDRSFVHVSYSYQYGLMAKLAMQAYLATAGRAKIGFTVTGKDSAGKPRYVHGERGSLERNVMRNYLALQAYISVNTGSPQEKMEARLHAWFALSEHYAAQLHELDLDEYLHEKHRNLDQAASAQ